MSDFTPEQQAEQMEAWGQWIGRLGTSLTDVGNPVRSADGPSRRRQQSCAW